MIRKRHMAKFMDHFPPTEEDASKMLIDMKEALHNRGYFTMWKDPVFAINRTEAASLTTPDRPNRFFVFDPPVPEFEPYDFSSVEIGISVEHISFSFMFYYGGIYQTYTDRDDIRAAKLRHDTEWVWILQEYFLDIERQFGLKWNVDTSKTEDTLYGRFPVNQAGKILGILEAIKELQRCFKYTEKEITNESIRFDSGSGSICLGRMQPRATELHAACR